MDLFLSLGEGGRLAVFWGYFIPFYDNSPVGTGESVLNRMGFASLHLEMLWSASRANPRALLTVTKSGRRLYPRAYSDEERVASLLSISEYQQFLSHRFVM